MTPFEHLSSRAQMHRLRQVALKALEAYPFEVRKLTVINHGFNTTFRVDDTSGKKYALRINVNSHRTIANVQAEMAWLDALSRETDLAVVKPVRTTEGHLMQMLEVPGLSGMRPIALFEWIPGPLLEDKVSVPIVRQLGEVTAKLHVHARQWSLPEGCALPVSNKIYLGDEVVLFDERGAEHLSRAQQNLFETASEKASAVLDGIWSREGTPIPIHTDLHDGNLKVWRNVLQVFDFDDCAFGHPVQDVANVLYYQITYPEREACHQAFIEGYQQVTPWTFDDTEIEALKAGRALLLINDVLRNLNPDIRKHVGGFLERTTQRMTLWLEEGTYRSPQP